MVRVSGLRRFIRRVFYKCLQTFQVTMSRTRHSVGYVLMVHQIGFDEGEFSITPDEFESLVAFLSKNHTVRLEDWEKEKDFYALTIDDVPDGFYHYAFPILKKYNLPFTLFVSLSLLDTYGYITTEQLVEIAQSELCTVGSHGVRHSEYYLMGEREKIIDLKESQKKLYDLVHKPIELFAFPYGSYYACGLNNKKLVLDTYKYGFGTIKSPITFPLVMPKCFLPRVNVDSSFIIKMCKS